MSWVVVFSGLAGAFATTHYKWGYYVFGVVALLYIAFVISITFDLNTYAMFCSWLLLVYARTSTFDAGPAIRSSYVGSAAFLAAAWFIYPVAWACSEGANIIGISGEMIWYSVLDILSGPVFLFFFLYRLCGVDHATLGLMSGKSTGYYGAGASQKCLWHSVRAIPGCLIFLVLTYPLSRLQSRKCSTTRGDYCRCQSHCARSNSI
jgi:bacteriorhodopsin